MDRQTFKGGSEKLTFVSGKHGDMAWVSYIQVNPASSLRRGLLASTLGKAPRKRTDMDSLAYTADF